MKSMSLTHDDIAKVLHYMFKDVFKFTPSGIWYYFNNHRWHNIGVNAFKLRNKINNDMVVEYEKQILILVQKADSYPLTEKKEVCPEAAKLQKIACDLHAVVKDLKDANAIKNIMFMAQGHFIDEEFKEKLNMNTHLICFNNGVYDLKTGLFRDGKQEDCISLSTLIDYKIFDENDPLIFEIYAFLCQVFPDESIRTYVLLTLSTFLEGTNPSEQFYIWTGCGGNGKSKVLNLIELAFGQYHHTIPANTFLDVSIDPNKAQPFLALLIGIRLASFSEPAKNKQWTSSTIKSWTGLDTQSIRGNYQDPFSFRPQVKFLGLCNDMPNIDANEESLKRRMDVTRFNSRFVYEPDPTKQGIEFMRDNFIIEKIENWKEAFMYILLQHYKEYKQDGIKKPQEIVNETRDYFNDNDNCQYGEYHTQHLSVVTPVPDQNGVTKPILLQLSKIWTHFKTCSFYDKKTSKMKDLCDYLKKKNYKFVKKDATTELRSVFHNLQIEYVSRDEREIAQSGDQDEKSVSLL